MVKNSPSTKSSEKTSAKSFGQSSGTAAPLRSDWLLLTDYASKYRISVSTLRRRIKNGAQPYRFEGGRYYLPDQLGSNFIEDDVAEHDFSSQENPEPAKVASSAPQTAASILAASIAPKDEPLITTTSKLLNELKQAYTLILHEKEEQIVYLKEEIADLKTLVRVLESENARLMNERERRSPEGRPPEKGPYGTA